MIPHSSQPPGSASPCREVPYVPCPVEVIDENLPGWLYMDISHKCLNDPCDAGKMLPSFPSCHREERPVFPANDRPHLMCMVGLASIEYNLEVAGNGVGIDRGADNDNPGGGSPHNPRHVILKNTGSGIIALVASDACPDREVINVYTYLRRLLARSAASRAHPAITLQFPAGLGLPWRIRTSEVGVSPYDSISPAPMPGLKFRRIREKFLLPFIGFCLHHPPRMYRGGRGILVGVGRKQRNYGVPRKDAEGGTGTYGDTVSRGLFP